MEQSTIHVLDCSADQGLSGSLTRILAEAECFKVSTTSAPWGGDSGNESSWLRRTWSGPPPELVAICCPGHVEAVTKLGPNDLELTFGLVPIVFVVDSGTPPQLRAMLEIGATDYLLAPLRANDVVARLSRLCSHKNPMEASVAALKERLGLQRFVGESASLLAEIQKIPKLARCDVSVLIGGETGTGKELVARAIHYLSTRCGGPFVPVNCGAIPGELVENELFGHESGAFTGATVSRNGLISEAEGGTLFLDEIDSLPMQSQVKLLRFLQDKEYRPLGSRKAFKANVRVISASNVAFEEALRNKKFRGDLYYRLNVASLTLPALRQRKEDIPVLARHFLLKYCAEHQLPAKSLSTRVMQKLINYEWPGNVRELENVIEHATVVSDHADIAVGDIRLPNRKLAVTEDSFKLQKSQAIAGFESAYIRQMLYVNHGNISKAAREARQNRRAFWRLMQKYHITASCQPDGAEAVGQTHAAGGQICPE